MSKPIESSFFKRVEQDIADYYSDTEVEISPGVMYSQSKTVERIFKFRNRYLSSSKLKEDLSYNFYFDIISPRVNAEIKNLRFDTKNIMVFSQNPIKDFAAVFLSNAKLKQWMMENGEDDKLKAAVEEFSSMGSVIFKKVPGTYQICDLLNTVITNTTAETIDDTDIIERHEMTASQLLRMTEWDSKDTIQYCGDKSFKTNEDTTDISSSSNRYEVYEFTGEVNEKEFNELQGKEGGSKDKYFLAKIVMSGLNAAHSGSRYILFSQKLPDNKKLSDYYIDAHRGSFAGRFLRMGIYETLLDHQIRANEIGNQLADGLNWSSMIIFTTSDTNQVMQNVRADMMNGDIISSKDMKQLEVRMQGADQLLADWNRLMTDADRLTNSYEVVTGESLPSGTPFRMGVLMDQNAGKLFVLLRQKISMPYRRVFKNWVLPSLVKDMGGEEMFRLVGDADVLDQFREIRVESWYMENLVKIGPHSREQAEAIKQEKLDELRRIDPVIENSKEIWKGVLPRLMVTITGENSDVQDQMQDLMALIKLEQDPDRVAWILDLMYKTRGIPIPPKREEQAPDPAQTVQAKTPEPNQVADAQNVQ